MSDPERQTIGDGLRQEAFMSLNSVHAHLLRDTLDPAHLTRFESIRCRHAVIHPYLSVRELLDALESWHLAIEAKDPLARALASEYQALPHPFPLGLLTLGLFPMLTGLRRGLVGNDLESQELDQMVLFAFLEAVSSVPVNNAAFNRTYSYLKCRTRDGVFGQLNKELLHLRTVIPVGDDNSGSWPLVSPPPGEVSERSCREILSPRELEIFTSAELRTEPLRDLVHEAYAHLPRSERERIYKRILKQENRARKKFKKYFRTPSVINDLVNPFGRQRGRTAQRRAARKA